MWVGVTCLQNKDQGWALVLLPPGGGYFWTS